MEVGIRVLAENIRTRQQRHVNSCFFTMVAVDDHGRPLPVPALTPSDDVEVCRFDAAERRRKLRRENEGRQVSIKKETQS